MGYRLTEQQRKRLDDIKAKLANLPETFVVQMQAGSIRRVRKDVMTGEPIYYKGFLPAVVLGVRTDVNDRRVQYAFVIKELTQAGQTWLASRTNIRRGVERMEERG